MYLQATTTYGSLIPGSEYIRSLVRQGTISKDAAKRLRWMDHYARSQNARQTCRYFGISAQTFYFSAWDKHSKFVGMKAYKRQTSSAAADFLHHLKTKFPFRIKAIQIDGGSEFMDQFEEACRRKKILLFLNPPRHPELSGGVERSNRTHQEEFYEVEDVSLDVGEHNNQLAKYEYCHNYIRPHRALDMQTPNEYYLQWKRIRRAQVSRMC